jgi:hypothetical protein
LEFKERISISHDFVARIQMNSDNCLLSIDIEFVAILFNFIAFNNPSHCLHMIHGALHRLIKMLFSNVCHSLPLKAIQVRDACDPFCVPNYHFSRFFVSASTFVGVFSQLRLSSIHKTFSQIVASERHMQISITVKSRIYLFW